MKQEQYTRQIDELRTQVEALYRQSDQQFSSAIPLLTETFEKLQVSLEELEVADEELHEQNVALMAVRQALELERRRYYDLFEFAPDGYLITDLRGVIQEVNQAAVQMFGFARQTALGRPLVMYVSKEGRRDFHTHLGRLVDIEGHSQNPNDSIWEIRFCSQREHTFYAEVRTIILQYNEGWPASVHWLVRDITEQKRAQAMIQEREANLRALAEATSVAIFIVYQAKIRYVNFAASQISGYSTEELLSKAFIDIIHPAYHETLQWHGVGEDGNLEGSESPGTHTADSRADNRLEVILLTKTGGERWVDLSLGSLTFDGMPAQVLTAYDITLREQAERGRKDLLRQLVNFQEEERRRISHELHDQMEQYLTALTLGLKSLEDQYSANSPATGKIKDLRTIADKVGQEIHHMAFQLRPTSLDDLGLHTTLSNYAEEWSQHNRIAVDFESTGIQDKNIPAQVATTVYRALQEALTNVLKHAKATQVSIHLNRSPSQVLLIIEDNGCGFDIEKITHKAYQEHRLGLLGMKERVELVGGNFNLESEPGKGTTIFIRISWVNASGPLSKI